MDQLPHIPLNNVKRYCVLLRPYVNGANLHGHVWSEHTEYAQALRACRAAARLAGGVACIYDLETRHIHASPETLKLLGLTPAPDLDATYRIVH